MDYDLDLLRHLKKKNNEDIKINNDKCYLVTTKFC